MFVEPFHLFRYVDEQAFRFNNREDADGAVISDYERFKTALSQIVGKRLTYKALTGKEAEKTATEVPFLSGKRSARDGGDGQHDMMFLYGFSLRRSV